MPSPSLPSTSPQRGPHRKGPVVVRLMAGTQEGLGGHILYRAIAGLSATPPPPPSSTWGQAGLFLLAKHLPSLSDEKLGGAHAKAKRPC